MHRRSDRFVAEDFLHLYKEKCSRGGFVSLLPNYENDGACVVVASFDDKVEIKNQFI